MDLTNLYLRGLCPSDITRGHELNPIQCVNAVDDEPTPTDFVYITENCFTSNIKVDRTITSLRVSITRTRWREMESARALRSIFCSFFLVL